MDGQSLYPDGFHPVNTFCDVTGTTYTRQLSRADTQVKYYYIDFGISVYVPPDRFPKLAIGGLGRDQDPPELSFTVPYDPFKLDIFIIGNMLRNVLYKVSSR